MASIHRGELAPLAVTIPKACELTGFGPTSIWAFLKDGRTQSGARARHSSHAY